MGSDAGAGPNLEKLGSGGLPGGGGARLEFCRLGEVCLLEAPSLSHSFGYDHSLSPCLWPFPVGAWVILTFALFESSANFRVV